MLTEIRLENFKCFGKPTAIPLARISVFIGPNGSGKSTPIQALMLLKQSLGQPSLVANGNLVKLGEFRDIVYRHNEQGLATIAISLITELKDKVPGPLFGQVNYVYKLVITWDGVRAQEVVLSMDELKLTSSYDRYTGRVSVSPQRFEFSGVTIQFGGTANVGRPLSVTGSGHSQGQETLARQLNNAFGRILAIPEDTIKNTYFVPPLGRGFSEPSYNFAQRSEVDFGAVPGTRAQAVASTLKYREHELEPKLSEQYQRITGIRVRFALRDGPVIFVESVTAQGDFNMVNEGFGSNQLVFLLGQLALAPEDSVIAIEEPEIHLHPRAQYELANILRETAIRDKKQLIITTHSEHILFSLLTSVASGALKTEDLAVNYFEKKEGVAEVRRLEVDDKGRVKGGLPGFFETELDQMDKYIKALSKQE